MDTFRLQQEQEFQADSHVEKILGTYADGDVTIACWEPGQTSPDHAHPDAVEIYLCHQGGGTMLAEGTSVNLAPGAFVVHPKGEFHQYVNGSERTLLFRIRYGGDRRWIER